MPSDNNPGQAGTNSASGYSNFVRIENTLYFAGTKQGQGLELMKWDGSSTPTLVKDIYPGNSNGIESRIAVINNKIYFSGNIGINGREPWVYDYVLDTAYIIADLEPGNYGSHPDWFTEYKGKIYFSGITTTTGSELYSMDISTHAITLVEDIKPGIGNSSPRFLQVINDELYFAASTDSFGMELYMLDNGKPKRITDVGQGTTNGINPNSLGKYPFIYLNGGIYFAGTDGQVGVELFRYDMSSGNVTLVHDFMPGAGHGAPQYFESYADKIFFSATDPVNGTELYSYEGWGTPKLVADIYTGTTGSDPKHLQVFDGHLYFSAETAATGVELYKLKDTPSVVQHIAFKAEVVVYPNPTNTTAYMNLKLDNTENIAVHLTDISGKIVFSTGLQQYVAGTHQITIPMHALPAGIYGYCITAAAGTKYMSGTILKE